MDKWSRLECSFAIVHRVIFTLHCELHRLYRPTVSITKRISRQWACGSLQIEELLHRHTLLWQSLCKIYLSAALSKGLLIFLFLKINFQFAGQINAFRMRRSASPSRNICLDSGFIQNTLVVMATNLVSRHCCSVRANDPASKMRQNPHRTAWRIHLKPQRPGGYFRILQISWLKFLIWF